jgi:hypothetical protein
VWQGFLYIKNVPNVEASVCIANCTGGNGRNVEYRRTLSATVIKMKGGEMCGACSTHGTDEKLRNLKEGGYLGESGIIART